MALDGTLAFGDKTTEPEEPSLRLLVIDLFEVIELDRLILLFDNMILVLGERAVVALCWVEVPVFDLLVDDSNKPPEGE